MSLSEDQARHGVVTHSSGNHAGALAAAAQLRGIPAHIVVPENTPRCKVDAVRGYGGAVYSCAPSMDAREAMCAEVSLLTHSSAPAPQRLLPIAYRVPAPVPPARLQHPTELPPSGVLLHARAVLCCAVQVQERTGAAFVPPYNDGAVMSGQGTIALEFLEQRPDLDAIVVPVSGGGMISGIAMAAKAIKPSIRILAAEPLGANNAADMAQAKAAGRIVPCPKPDTIADGLQGRLGSLTWPVVRDLVDAVITVSEEEIVNAMRLVFERMKLVVEPSGAVGLAAALRSQQLAAALPAAVGGADSRQQTVGIILCGGNVDMGAKGFWDAWVR